ncbi:hypothetical protein KC19_9G020500 [Ceratodon purpureus]|uniref:Peptidase A1 domain-containing protein n=1 Tax=Ceratodon purpureus TaxID=3225 RepID=A0A8T0GQL1_CERPU|nr:hypothetical protein KC19_9G020500 [Ceratodon purpureus]
MTLPTHDASEKNVFGLFGCVLQKTVVMERLPLLTDGVVGLSSCEGSLVDQLWTSNAISQKVLGVCFAKEIRRRPSRLRPAGRVGFLSMGMDFEEQFDGSNMVWSKLNENSCLLSAKLHSIVIGNKRIAIKSGDGTMDGGTTVAFDTGCEMSYFGKDVFDKILEAVSVSSKATYPFATETHCARRINML